MKIIFALDTLQTGGAEKSTLDIVSRLPQDIEPVVVSFYNNLELLPAFERAGIQCINFQLTGKYSFREAIEIFKKVCVKEKPDLVVATLLRAEVITRIACKELGIKNIGTFVNDTYSKHELRDLSLLMKLKIAFFWVVNKWTALYCYRFLANSKSIKESNSKSLLIDPSKIDVIHRGRSISKYAFQTARRFSNDEVHFFNVGRLLKRKGQFELIEAFARFNRRYPKSKLSIAGEGAFRKELEALIAKNNLQDKVIMLGNVQNVPELLNTCDVFVFPSYYEGFSGALVEAMLAGTPILASDISMNKEAVKHMETAYIFNVKNIISLEQALAYAVENKEIMKEMAIKARQRAVENYDIDEIAQQHAELYRKYIG